MFTKGKSGNPGGRPKITPEERKAWEVLAIKARSKLEEILEADDVQPQVVTKIAEIASNRAWGTPTQAIELGADTDSQLSVKIEYVSKAE
jgi:hypothetical protein